MTINIPAININDKKGASSRSPIPNETIPEIQKMLSSNPYFVVLKGVNTKNAKDSLVNIGYQLGEVPEIEMKRYKCPVKHLIPHTDIAIESGRVLTEWLHTDSTSWPVPNKLTCLLCIHPARTGGVSNIMPFEEVIDILKSSSRGTQALNYLQNRPVIWNIDNDFSDRDIRQPCISETVLRWMPYTINYSSDSEGLKLKKMLEIADDIINSSTKKITFKMKKGDLLILNNLKVLHSRTSVESFYKKKRELLRLKLN